MTIPYLDADEVRRRLPVLALVDALEDALRGGLDPEADAPRSVVDLGERGALLVMPSAAAADHPVVKVVSVGGRPRVQGVCIAFDGESLAPKALVDGVAATNLRTSAVSALAARHLATPDARRLTILGRGPQAHAHVEALKAVLPSVEHVELLGRDDAARVPDAVAQADIVCCCTTAREPLFDGALPADHATVIAIGSHEPDARETDSALAARATVVVESPEAALREAGDVVLAIADAALTAGELLPLAELVSGRQEPAPDRPRLFKSTGMAWEDAVTVDALLRR